MQKVKSKDMLKQGEYLQSIKQKINIHNLLNKKIPEINKKKTNNSMEKCIKYTNLPLTERKFNK